MDQENRYESNFQLCLRDVSQTEAWELTYIIIQLLKDKGNIHEIYQMLTDGTILNRRVHVDPGDALIDFALLESLTRQGSYPGKILQREGIRTDAELVKFVYNHNPQDAIRLCGRQAIASIAAYMNIRGIIPEGSGMVDVVNHLTMNARGDILHSAELKCKIMKNKMREEDEHVEDGNNR